MMVQTLLQKIRGLIYGLGLRPKFWTTFYDYRLEAQDQWRTGKK